MGDWQPVIGQEVRCTEALLERFPEWRGERLWVLGVCQHQNHPYPKKGLNVTVVNEWPITSRSDGATDGFIIHGDGPDELEPVDRVADAKDAEIIRLKAENLAFSERCKKQERSISKLRGALETAPPIKLDAGSWWYPEGDTSSDACCQSAYEVAQQVADDMQDGDKRIIVIERALELPDVFGLIHVFTAAEMEARDDDKDWVLSLHATAEDAEKARAALVQRA